MTAKRNGSTPAKAPAAAPASKIPPVAPKSLAGRVTTLEETVAAQAATIERLSGIVLQWAEDQTVAQTLPQIEGQLRAQIRANLAENGLAGVTPPQGTPAG